eukprot:456178-Pyramimonas_sp.AAC.1
MLLKDHINEVLLVDDNPIGEPLDLEAKKRDLGASLKLHLLLHCPVLGQGFLEVRPHLVLRAGQQEVVYVDNEQSEHYIHALLGYLPHLTVLSALFEAISFALSLPTLGATLKPYTARCKTHTSPGATSPASTKALGGFTRTWTVSGSGAYMNAPDTSRVPKSHPRRSPIRNPASKLDVSACAVHRAWLGSLRSKLPHTTARTL